MIVARGGAVPGIAPSETSASATASADASPQKHTAMEPARYRAFQKGCRSFVVSFATSARVSAIERLYGVPPKTAVSSTSRATAVG